jgi:hypothetical protein
VVHVIANKLQIQTSLIAYSFLSLTKIGIYQKIKKQNHDFFITKQKEVRAISNKEQCLLQSEYLPDILKPKTKQELLKNKRH